MEGSGDEGKGCLAPEGGKRKASSDLQAAATEKKKRKKKDPNAPKRPMTSYFLFLEELRRKHEEEESSIHGKEFSKLASAKWKTLNPAEKKRYTDQYDILMVENSKKKSDYHDKKIDTLLSQSRQDELMTGAMKRAEETVISAAKLARLYWRKYVARAREAHERHFVFGAQSCCMDGVSEVARRASGWLAVTFSCWKKNDHCNVPLSW